MNRSLKLFRLRVYTAIEVKFYILHNLTNVQVLVYGLSDYSCRSKPVVNFQSRSTNVPFTFSALLYNVAAQNYTCHSGSIRTNMSTNDPNLVESHIPSSTVSAVVFALLALLLFSQECLKQNFFSRNTRARWPRRSRSRSFTPTARRSCWRCPTRSPRSSTRTSRLSR